MEGLTAPDAAEAVEAGASPLEAPPELQEAGQVELKGEL